MITLQAPPMRGFRVSAADVTLSSRSASTPPSAKLLSGNTFSYPLRIVVLPPCRGEETSCLSGYSTPRFSCRKSVPSHALKMQSHACIFALRAGLVGARNLPLRFDPVQSAGAPGAMSPAVTGVGHGPLSCSSNSVNSFFPLPSTWLFSLSWPNSFFFMDGGCRAQRLLVTPLGG